jgi:hypothetical protein
MTNLILWLALLPVLAGDEAARAWCAGWAAFKHEGRGDYGSYI